MKHTDSQAQTLRKKNEDQFFNVKKQHLNK